jgi:glutathione S-transferase
MTMPILHGADGSPFVRKVKVALAEKNIAFESNPLVPFNQPADYFKKSPLGKIPCWEDGSYTLPDSSCILAYLERAHPNPPLYPSDAKQYGRALWYEEYGDTRLVENVGAVFFQRVIRPAFFKQETDKDAVAKALASLPAIFDYLEGEIGDREFLVGDRFSIADIGIASPIVNFNHGGESVDKKRWPKFAAFTERILSRPSFKTLIEKERAFFNRSAA